jgi:nucleoside-diphosphate-sugar epimerase
MEQSLKCANIEKAKKILNYEPTIPIKVGINLFDKWFKNATFYAQNKNH